LTALLNAVERESTKMTAPQTKPTLLPRKLRLTPTQVEGPYFIANSPQRKKMFPAAAVGSEVSVSGQVLDQDGNPLASAAVSVWVADPQGRYDNQEDNGDPKTISVAEQVYRGRVITDKNGRYSFSCLRPGNYFDGGWNLWRPAHIHVKVEASGYVEMTTQLYFDDDAQNSHDIPGDDFFLPELALQLAPAIPAAGVVQKGTFNFVLKKAS
jgi:protocatechuate 3,4-dioxygenase beta subunit